MSHGGGGKEGEGFPVFNELKEASKEVWNFLANLITALVNTILGTGQGHH